MGCLFRNLSRNKKGRKESCTTAKHYDKNKVYSPFKGRVVALTNVPDEVFAQKMLGDGIAVDPEEEVVFSPVVGTVISSFPTGHAFTIKTKTNHAILIHVGLDTVNLKGKGFKVITASKTRVTPETKLVEVDLIVTKKIAKSMITPMIIVNDPTYKQGKVKLHVKAGETVAKGQLLFEII